MAQRCGIRASDALEILPLRMNLTAGNTSLLRVAERFMRGRFPTGLSPWSEAGDCTDKQVVLA